MKMIGKNLSKVNSNKVIETIKARNGELIEVLLT
tara:strand:- start:572 stop:673 length:102 start_codon:yes stop_codon:yes gene_type:complete